MTSKSDSFIIMNSSAINGQQSVPFFGIDSTTNTDIMKSLPNFGESHQKNDLSSNSKANNDHNNISEIQMTRQQDVVIPEYNEIKKETSAMVEQSEEERREKGRKEIAAPPTFSDRYEIMAAAKALEKKPINTSPSSSSTFKQDNDQEIFMKKPKKQLNPLSNIFKIIF